MVSFSRILPLFLSFTQTLASPATPYEAVFVAFEQCLLDLPFAQPKLRRFETGLSESSIQYRYGGQEQKMGVEKMIKTIVDDLQTPVYVVPFERYEFLSMFFFHFKFQTCIS